MKFIELKYLTYLPFCLIVMFASCDDNFLEQAPKDQISSKYYWKTPGDLKTYMNQFYPRFFKDGGKFGLSIYDNDEGTDNQIEAGSAPERLGGTRTVPSSGGGWGFSSIRDINYFFKHYKKVKENYSYDKYKQYLGEAYFFRAYYYFNKVKNFGDFPYYSKVLKQDSEELYKSRTPRQEVIDSVIVNLDKAIDNMGSGPNKDGTRLNMEVAQLFKSRVCLYEATWEKYHDGTVFGVPDPKINEYLTMAKNAASAVINSDYYSIYTTGKPESDYYNLFNRTDYSDNPEVMLWEKYSLKLDKVHNHQVVMTDWGGGDTGITKSLVDDYLSSDGLPIALSPLYKGDATLKAVMSNRDPRLDQTVWDAGDPLEIVDGDTLHVFEKSNLPQSAANKQCPTGYQLRKGSLPNPEQYGASNIGTTGTPYFRYAEALLNYAEAKAELGNITQGDIDMTINKLRDRVDMPHLNINKIPEDPNWSFPDVSPLINEIRRERRVEFAVEGYRWDDLARWRAHEVFKGRRLFGINFDSGMYPGMEIGVDVYLNEEGYVDPYKKRFPGGLKFDPGRDYLAPIPIDQLTLNENLEQNPGW